MDSKVKLEVGQAVELEMKNGGIILNYPSNIEALDRSSIQVATPIWAGRPVALPTGQRVTVYFRLDRKAWSFESEVVGKQQGREKPVTVLKQPKLIQEIGQRRYFPLDVQITPARLSILDDRVGATMGYKAVIRRIGGSEVTLSSVDSLDVGTNIKFELNLPNGQTNIKAMGQVMSVRPERVQGDFVFNMRVILVRISLADREALVRYILQGQATAVRQQKLTG
ncbi:MAG: hypothetical protein A2Z04_07350 [Chloroflexi bacterium RBG_16_57_9]|nr:MAG: hypothetical protein A2Z04_07350 [Chloroflexi bacterium RBG_16_57_9]